MVSWFALLYSPQPKADWPLSLLVWLILFLFIILLLIVSIIRLIHRVTEPGHKLLNHGLQKQLSSLRIPDIGATRVCPEEQCVFAQEI
jgi:antibiotic biosynthesis monooxygenase (ABM) superfamily enzyme